MLQTTSVKVQATNVRCRVSKRTMITINEKCLKLWTTSVRCKVSKWMSVRVLNEWVKCKIFEIIWTWNYKRSQKPLRAYFCPIHRHHHAKDHGARRLLIEGCCARGASMEGSSIMCWQSHKFHYNSPISLRLTFQNHGHSKQGWGFLWLCKKFHNLGNILVMCVASFHVCFIFLHFLLQSL
jgi:hypothetical protein